MLRNQIDEPAVLPLTIRRGNGLQQNKLEQGVEMNMKTSQVLDNVIYPTVQLV